MVLADGGQRAVQDLLRPVAASSRANADACAPTATGSPNTPLLRARWRQFGHHVREWCHDLRDPSCAAPSSTLVDKLEA
ncbi:hypothetical protein [Streptomyces sp. NPDC003032]